jgi:hypothetical protein
LPAVPPVLNRAFLGRRLVGPGPHRRADTVLDPTVVDLAGAGPAVVDLAGAPLGGLRRPEVLLPVAAALAVLVADLTGLSKAEVERIWLPFTVWLVAATALLPATVRRPWLAAQAVTALAVNHLVLTNW